jgi:antitoxin component YwqK of YwqJK toxin-antitoxin module
MNNKILFVFGIVMCSATGISFSAEVSPEYDSYKIIQNGAKLHDEKKYAQAIEEFKKVNKNDTNYVLAILELANSYIANKQDSLAVIACDKVLFFSTSYAPAVLLYKASALDNMNRQDEAEKVYREGISRYPLNNSFYHELGVMKYNQKKYKEANDLFIQSIKTNPFDAASHFSMGNLAFLQGKIVPAMLAWSYYLMIDNSSERAQLVLGRLEKLAQNEFTFDDAIKIEGLSDQDDFSELESLIKSKIALSNKYKATIDLNYSLTKQLQLLFEKLPVSKDDKGFYMQYYAPLFAAMQKNHYYEPFIYSILGGTSLEKVKSWLKKNNDEFGRFSVWFIKYVGENNTTFETMMNGKMVPVRHWYSSGGKIMAAGNVNARNEDQGYWTYYFPTGILKSEGGFNSQSKREGEWKFYYADGTIKSIETYNNGIVEGRVQNYFENGSIHNDKVYKNNMFEGRQTSYYPTGVKNIAADYIADKENGREMSYYPNGKLMYDVKVINDQFTGDLIQYYDNGHLKQKTQLKNGKIDGKYEEYYNYPEKAIKETYTYVLGTAVGDARTYHSNGKTETSGKLNKEGMKDGKWLTFYDTDTLSAEENYTDGKLNGISRFYDYKGRLTSELVYKNDILQQYKAYAENGKIIFQNEKDGRRNYDLLLYYPNGNKQKEGKIVNAVLDGEWNFYDQDGYLKDKIVYSNGVKNGKSVSYYYNGKIKSQNNYVNGESDGYYKEYYIDGKLKREGPYIKDKCVGEWKYYNNNGNLQNVFFYKDDEKDGWQEYYAVNGNPDSEEFLEFNYIKKRISYDTSGRASETKFDKGTGSVELKFPNGKKYYTATLQNDMLQGPATHYFPSGQVREADNYVDNRIEGESKTYYPSGKIEWLNNFVYGMKHGKQIHYYEDGNIQEESDYRYGVRDGKYISYYPNRQVENVINYKNDVLEGERMNYDESGELILKRFYHDDYMTGFTYSDKNGGLVPVIPVKNETGAIKAYYKNGATSIEYTLRRGNIEGDRIIYFPNGKVSTQEFYVSGDQTGPEKNYYASGKLKSDENWYGDNKDGKSTTYYENGKIKSEGFYMEGRKHGQFRYYDSNGKLTATYVFYDGDLIDSK